MVYWLIKGFHRCYTGFDFMKQIAELETFKRDFDRELVAFFAAERKRVHDDQILLEVLDLVEKQISRGGKRIRPLLTVIAYRLAGGKNTQAILKASLAVEIVHQFILMHDDIADRDEKRYGRPTLQFAFSEILKKKYQVDDFHLAESMAMGSADYVYGLARKALYVSGFPAERIVKAGECISDYLASTVSGWLDQFYQLKQPIQSIKEADYLRATEKVTAYYSMEGPMQVGLLLAGNLNQKLENSLHKYALAVGMAYQIKDDILGLFGESQETGKPVGNDYREGKKSLLILRAWASAKKADRVFLEKTLGTAISLEELVRAQKIIQETGVLNDVQEEASRYAKKGMMAVRDFPELVTLAEFAVERKK